MIIYKKLSDYLKENNMMWKDLQNAVGVSPSVMAKLQKNRPCNTDTLNKVCEYLQIQPGEIMEWVPDSEWETQNSKRAEIEAKIAALKAELDTL